MKGRKRGTMVDGTPKVEISVGTLHHSKRLDAIVDTGCNCALVMSRSRANQLGLLQVGMAQAKGVFGNAEDTAIFEAHVHDWFGLSGTVTVHAPDSCPDTLIGTVLLGGKTISFQKGAGGNDVHIVPSDMCQRTAAGKRKCPIR